MSNINPRRAPNVSQYLANLNTVPTQQEAPQGDFELGNESLDFLLNTEFFDFDASYNPNVEFAGQQPTEVQRALRQQQQQQQQQAQQQHGPGFQFSEFNAFPPQFNTNSPSNTLPPTPTNGLQGPYPAQGHAFPSASVAGEKRRASTAQLSPVGDLEESSRMAAEEDKRRRNTAASARFRVKKKQREQALEKQAKDMADKVSLLEGKVQQLEMENKWLKGLITEKSDVKTGGGMDEQFKRFVADKTKESKAAGEKSEERSTQLRTDGVGTEGEETKEVDDAVAA